MLFSQQNKCTERGTTVMQTIEIMLSFYRFKKDEYKENKTDIIGKYSEG